MAVNPEKEEDVAAVEFQFPFSGKDGKAYVVSAEYFVGDEGLGVDPLVSVVVVQDEGGHAVPDWQRRFDLEKFQDEALTAGEAQFRAEGHVAKKDVEAEEGEEDEEPEEPEEDEEEPEEPEWHGEEGEEEEEEESSLAKSAEEEEEEEFHEPVENRNLTSVQRRMLTEDIGFSQGDEDVLVKALDIQDSLQGEKRDPTPDEALTLWKANKLRHQVHSVRRRMHELRRSRPPRPVVGQPQMATFGGLLPAPEVKAGAGRLFTRAELEKAADEPWGAFGELPDPMPPPPVEPMPPARKPPFKAILDGALAEEDAVSAAANAGPAAADAAVASAAAPATAAKAPATATGAQAQALDRIIKKVGEAVGPLTKNLALTAKVARQLGTKDIEQWVPKTVRDKYPAINWPEIWEHPEKVR